MEKTHRGSKPNEGWLRGGGLNQKIMKTYWNTSDSIQYTKSYLHHAKKTNILHTLNDNKNKTKNLCNILRSLTKQKEENPMPSTRSQSDVSDTFADFFLNKIKKIREQFQNQSTKGNTPGNAQK